MKNERERCEMMECNETFPSAFFKCEFKKNVWGKNYTNTNTNFSSHIYILIFLVVVVRLPQDTIFI